MCSISYNFPPRIEKIFEILYPVNPVFGIEDILDLISKKPELKRMNNMYLRNEGVKSSIEKDKNHFSRTCDN